MTEPTIENLLREGRTFPPPEDFAARATIPDEGVYQQAEDDWQGWWVSHAERLRWLRPWDTVLEWDAPHAKWFTGGQLNVSDNCLDRHVDEGHGDQVAYHWEGEDGSRRTLTYRDLLEETCRFANALKSLGVGKGDRVAIYLPMIPELPVAMLACARIGAIHSVVFAGFSAQSLVDRIDDADAQVVITADGAYRKGNVIPLKANADTAMADTHRVRTCVVVRRTGEDVVLRDERDHWYHDVVEGQSTECPPSRCTPRTCSTSSTPRGPRGSPRASCTRPAATWTQVAATHRMVFDLKPDTDVYWCAADIGWVTGHSYIVYGPLANRTTSVLEGAPDHPARDRFWSIVEDYGVTILYTAPTAIRTFMKWGPTCRAPTTCPACACSAASASRSTPRPGSGTTSTSAAGAAPSWTPGGRPRRGRS